MSSRSRRTRLAQPSERAEVSRVIFMMGASKLAPNIVGARDHISDPIAQ